MITSNFYTKQAKKHYVPKIGTIGMVIFTLLWVVLSLFAFHCSGVEAAVPKPEEISGDYHYYHESDGGRSHGSGSAQLILQGNTLCVYFWGEPIPLTYNAQAGTAHGSYTDKHGQYITVSLRANKGADGKVHVSGTHSITFSYEGKKRTWVYSINATKTRSIGVTPSGEKKTDKDSEKTKKDTGQKNQNQKQSTESREDAERKAVPGEGKDNTWDSNRDDDAYDRDNLPDSDAGKAAWAGGTGLGGAMLGGAAGVS